MNIYIYIYVYTHTYDICMCSSLPIVSLTGSSRQKSRESRWISLGLRSRVTVFLSIYMYKCIYIYI